ncbi:MULTISPECIES: DUF6803 family protein [Arsenicicoccus]|uniref:Permease n=1 Tax=Arsenicicoccus bolidensis TaxID=229480 RepID=A0ABS9PY41_9MICO|nr:MULTISPECIES: DUF6803 family protein [Arsenicicoccus]MCG7320530.1 hypothetical protein [Arsenicicoccus bolidensis]
MSTLTAATPATTDHAPRRGAATTLAVLTALAVVGGLVAPDRTQGSGMDGMSMTHYMGLLAVQQPWNLLLFMAIPVILAETLAITELVILFARPAPSWVHGLSRWAGLLAGPVMVAILVHLLRHAVIPLTLDGGWRGPADVIAVLAYLLGAVPMVGISLVAAGLIARDERHARKLHVVFVAVFLVVAHVAMIAGMLDPAVMGWTQGGGQHEMPGGTMMPGMHH